MPWSTANGSSSLKGNVEEFGGGFPMLEALGNDTKGKGLHARDCFIAIRAVAHDTGQGRHLGKPPAVVLAFKLDRKYHKHHCTIAFGLVHGACHYGLAQRPALFRPVRGAAASMGRTDAAELAIFTGPLVAKTARVLASERTHPLPQEEP